MFVQNNNATKYNKIIFCLGLAFILFLVALRNLFGFTSFPVILVLLVVTVLAAFCDKSELIALTITFIPLASAFQYKYAILICMVVYLLKFGKEFRINWTIIPLLLMFVWELFHAIGQQFSLLESLRGFTELIFITFLLLCNFKDLDFKIIVRALAITSIVVMTIKILSLLIESGFDFVAIFEGTYRFGKSDADVKEYSLSYNSNQLGLICNLSIIGLLQLVLQKKNNKLDYLWIVVLALFGVMTMSRTFILCFLIIMVLFLFSRKEPITKKIKKFLIIACSIFVIFLLANWLMPTVVERFYERFLVDDITNHRGDLLVFYNKHIFSSAKYSLFGIGIQNMGDKLISIYPSTFTFVPHNGIQEILVAWGMPGLLLFGWFVLSVVLIAKAENKLSLGGFIPLIIILISVQAGQFVTSGTSLLAIAFAYIGLICVRRS